MSALLPVRRAGGQAVLPAAAAALGLMLASTAVAQEAGPLPRERTRERTVIEEIVAAGNPCAALRTEIGGQPIGLDALDDVEIRTANAALDGDAVTLSLSGRLACRTPEGSLLQGDAASDVDATAAVSLADCAAADVRVTLSAFGGSFAGIIEALRPTIEARIAEAARPQIVAACRDLRGA